MFSIGKRWFVKIGMFCRMKFWQKPGRVQMETFLPGRFQNCWFPASLPAHLLTAQAFRLQTLLQADREQRTPGSRLLGTWGSRLVTSQQPGSHGCLGFPTACLAICCGFGQLGTVSKCPKCCFYFFKTDFGIPFHGKSQFCRDGLRLILEKREPAGFYPLHITEGFCLNYSSVVFVWGVLKWK